MVNEFDILTALEKCNNDIVAVGKMFKVHPNKVKKVLAKSIQESKRLDEKPFVKASEPNIASILDIEEAEELLFIKKLRKARRNGIDKLTMLIKSEEDPNKLVTAVSKIDEVLKRYATVINKTETKDEFFKLD